MHTIQPVPKKSLNFYAPRTFQEMEVWCALRYPDGDISPCSHFDHCERPAVIWLYFSDCAPAIFGFCNTCYAWCYPAPRQWYRVVGISSEFRGRL